MLGPETRSLEEPKPAAKIVPKIAEKRPAVGGRSYRNRCEQILAEYRKIIELHLINEGGEGDSARTWKLHTVLPILQSRRKWVMRLRELQLKVLFYRAIQTKADIR